jgi:CBS domain-containing protein
MRYMIEMGIRRIPIFEGDNVVGLVTEKDILSYLFEETTLAKLGKNGVEVLASKKVEDCMTTDFPKIFPQAKVSYAAGLMSEGGKGCSIVYDGYKPRGIITEKDLVRALLRL